MRLLTPLLSFVRTLTRSSRLDAELDAELRAHVDLLTDEHIRAGKPPAVARRAAMLEVGGVEQVKERVRDVRVGIWIDTAWQDTRYAVRMLRKAPGFTFVAVISLALGIGLNAVLFSAIEAVLLRRLPYVNPERVVDVHQVYRSGLENAGVPPGVYLQWQRASRSFDELAIYDGFANQAVFRDRTVVERIDILRVSSSFFAVFGRPPAFGRVFDARDDAPGANVAVVSDDWWQRRWGGDPGLIGRSVLIDNVRYQIVGVMPPGFRFYHERGYGSPSDATDVWLSNPFRHTPVGNDLLGTLGAVGRLGPGVSPEQAAAELSAVSLAFRRDRGLPDDLAGVAVVPLRQSLTVSSRRPLLISWGIAAFVLFIAAANVAVLALARADSRRPELDMRRALGAGRGRVIRQLLTENALLGVAAGALGLIVVTWTAPLLQLILPHTETMVRLGEARQTSLVLAFTVVATLIATIVFGGIAAWSGSRSVAVHNGYGPRVTSDRRSTRLRHTLIVFQVSLSLIIMAGTALLIATAWREQRVPLGFSPDHLLMLNVRYPRAAPYVSDVGVRSVVLGLNGSEAQGPSTTITLPHYALTRYGEALPRRIAERLARVPGVGAAAVASNMPMRRSNGAAFRIEGTPWPADQADGNWGVHCPITPDYFKTLGMRLLRGRGLSETDTRGSPKVIVVNETLARVFLGGVDRALGRRIIVNPGAIGMDVVYEIVGVTNDVRFWTRTDVGPQMYTAFDQSVDDAYGAIALIWRLDFWVAARTHDNTAATVAAITRAVHEVDGGAPVERVEFMERVVARGSEDARGLLRLLIISTVTGVFLSAIGVFGVTAFGVSQRFREFGIRAAMGASPKAIATHVLSGAMRVAALGVLVGALGSFWTNRLLEGELYEVRSTDPWVFAAAACLLSAVVLAATWLPARRAARVDPVVALRAE